MNYSHLMSVHKAAEELDVSVGGQLAEVAVRHVAVLFLDEGKRAYGPEVALTNQNGPDM